MRRGVKIGIAVALVFFFAPIIPLAVPNFLVLPLAGTPCGGVLPNSPRILVLASPSFVLSPLFMRGVTDRFGLDVVPSSSYPVQFAPIGYYQGPVMCG